ncbi:MAG: TatD family hydrolase [Oscillospiraceae bacterium]|nr:TatD family hydrolase [Oscillospiraceae bacterium]
MKPIPLNEIPPVYTGIFDSHAHYDSAQFDGDRDKVLAALSENGICGVIDVGCDLESSLKAAELARTIPGFYASVGYHPHEADSYTEEDMAKIIELTKDPRVVAIGEIGLDYHYDFSPREKQKEVFEIQLKLAKELDLPVIIHSREATQDTLETLAKFPGLRGVVHCFSGSAETANELLKMGFYIGFTGVITFPNARKILEACEAVPADRLLLETDCPYMAPVPYRGKRCWSPLIRFTAEKAAELHNMEPQQLIDRARENTLRLFEIEST